MNANYAIQTEDDLKIRTWFNLVDKRLRSGKGVLIKGATRQLGKGLYVVSVETVVDTFAFTAWPLMFVLGGVAAFVIFHNVTASNWLVGIGGGATLLIYATMAPGLHRLLMRLTLRRLTGKWVKVKPVTSEVLRRLAYGQV